MSRRIPRIVAAFALTMSAPLAAQGRSAVSPADLDAAITTRQSETRARVEQFFKTPEVRNAAEKLGISPTTLTAKVAGLDSATLNAVAAQIDQVQEPLAGGLPLGLGLVGLAVLIIILILVL